MPTTQWPAGTFAMTNGAAESRWTQTPERARQKGGLSSHQLSALGHAEAHVAVQAGRREGPHIRETYMQCAV